MKEAKESKESGKVRGLRGRLRRDPAGRGRRGLRVFLLCLTGLAGLWGLSVPAAQSYTLPDTGQSKCYDNDQEIPCPGQGERFHGQDAQYRGPQPSFRDNGNGTVSDLNTGLAWQKGDSQNDQYYTWDEATDYCASLALAGYGDWRLPSKKELISIVNYGRYYPAIDTGFFPECRSDYYWSGSTYALSPDDAWYVLFLDGYVNAFNKSDYSMYVRCVRGGS